MFHVLVMGQRRLLTRREAARSVCGPMGASGEDQDSQGLLHILMLSHFPPPSLGLS